MFKCLNVKMEGRGVSIYLALIIMFILIAIGLGVSLIIVSQMKMIRGMGDSVVAFYAADTGIENSFYEKRKGSGEGTINDGAVGNATYSVTYEYDPILNQAHYKSIGGFPSLSPKVKRAIDASYSAYILGGGQFILDCAGDCGGYVSGSCTGSTSCLPPPLNSTRISGDTCYCQVKYALLKIPTNDGWAVEGTYYCVKSYTTPCTYQCDPGLNWDGVACVSP